MSETIEAAIYRLEREIEERHYQIRVLKQVGGFEPPEPPPPPTETVSMQVRTVILPPSVPPDLDEQGKAQPEPVPGDPDYVHVVRREGVPLVAEPAPQPEPEKPTPRKRIDEAEVRKLHDDGLHPAAIAERIGVSRAGVLFAMRRIGIEPRRKRMPMPDTPAAQKHQAGSEVGGVVSQALAWCKTQQMIVIRGANGGFFHAGQEFPKARDFIDHVNGMRRQRGLPPFPGEKA